MHLVVLSLTVIYTTVGLISVNASTCTLTGRTVYRCTGASVPVSIPNGVDRVILKGINLDTFHEGQFAHSSWNQTVYLQIDANHGRLLTELTFGGLDNLKHLKLRGEQVFELDERSFRGLPSVEKLDLSDNPFLTMSQVLQVCRDNLDKTLPSLRWLNIAKLGSFNPFQIQLNSSDFEILTRGNIEHLDLSNIIFEFFQYQNILTPNVCSHLRQLILKDTVFPTRTHVEDPHTNIFNKCPSLRIIDMRNSHALVPIFRSFVVLGRHQFDIPIDQIVDHMKDWIFSNFINVEILMMGNTLWNAEVNWTSVNRIDLTDYLHSLHTLDISRNNIKVINAEIILHRKTIQNLRNIDLSGNNLEYISPRVIGISLHTERLNLSLNNLNKMYQDHRLDFELLLNKLGKLQIIGLSRNGLTSIPINMFIHNNRLQTIDLSDNLLTRVDFNLEHLRHLQVIDISGNQFKVLYPATLIQFGNIFSNRVRLNDKGNVDVDQSIKSHVRLHDNPFLCECKEKVLTSIEWIEHSGFVSMNVISPVCTLNGKQLNIFDSALMKTKLYCLHVKMTKNGVRVGSTVITLIIFTVIAFLCIRRRLNKKNAIKNFIKKIEAGDKLKHLIFLSFCNEDGDLVMDHIYPRMKAEASLAIKCDRNLLCCGEMDFRPGMSVCLEAMRCIEESAVVIFVISSTFCKKSWCKMEVDTANALRKPVILLMLEKVQPEVMTPYIRKLFNRYTRATWNEDQHGGHPHPPWPVLMSSVIELASSFNADNETDGDDNIEMAVFG